MTYLPVLQVDAASGYLTQARLVATPNYDARPDGSVPELIVVHGISMPPAEFGGPWIDKLLTNTLPVDAHPHFKEVVDLRVSTHLLIRRDAELVQYVSLNNRAWHAGVSKYQGRERCNDFSVGIELEGAEGIAYESIQYRSLVDVIKALCAAYPSLSRDRVVGHCDIAPGRKGDPWDVFDWPRLRALLKVV
ncbi:MAG TPA: 1,6-anhydro-N-acetylmuramyl-L-alanine amidase AmpD [Steroidobacteraceae bacterium]|nr:1,6-anhydro-N-acetylmuramyl-L-alanine amidase AmpD [Steroidobacteraceae bacterium]